MSGVRRRRGAAAALVAATLLVDQSAPAEPARSPDFTKLPPMVSRTVSKRTGETLFTTRNWVSPVEHNGETLVAIHSQTWQAIGAVTENRTVVRATDAVRCVEQENRVRAASGEIVAQETKQFRREVLPLSARDIPDDTYPNGGVLLYLLGYLPLGSDGRGSFHILGQTDVWKIDAWADGTEEIKSAAGTFACRRLRLRPNPESLNVPGFLRPFLRYFIPEFVVWVTEAPPHLAVRIEGPLGPPRERDVVLEVVQIDPLGP